MRTPSAKAIRRAGALLAALVASASIALGQQMETPVAFPATDQTSVTDCSTPTVLNLPGGATITLEGGQFIHYKDANFDGTMYATTSAGGCQVFPAPPLSFTMIKVTFSQPVPSVTVTAYNFVGQDQDVGFQPFDQLGQIIVGEGNDFPSQQLMPDPFHWPLFGSALTGSFVMEASTPPMPPDFTGIPTNWAWGITSLSIPQSGGDFVRFDYSESGSGSDDGKILLSTAPWDIAHPSQYQLQTNGAPQVRVTGTLIDGVTKQPKAGTVYLRLDDPPDTADYRGGDATTGDNDGPAAQLSAPTTAGIASLQTDAGGKFATTMTITSQTAGDNYQFAGSANASFTCPGGPCPKSGIFTLWKRIYVEEEHMFRQGSFLNGIANAGSNEIPVADGTPFQNLGAGATLELVHADSGFGDGFYFDFVTFDSVSQNENGDWIVKIVPSSSTSRDYGAEPPHVAQPVNDIMRDAVGIIGMGTYEPNDEYVAPLFNSMYVDVEPARQTVTEVPFVTELGLSDRTYFASRWLQNGTATSPYTKTSTPNSFHRIAITQLPFVYQVGRTGGVELGLTTVGSETNWSLIMAQRIEDVTTAVVLDRFGSRSGAEYAGLSTLTVSGEVTAHETVHFWVNIPTGIDHKGHCAAQSYANAQLNCLMHVPYAGPGLGDGIVNLHYLANGADSEYMTVRRAADPVPQQ
ncbi:MAG TPA: hypothetical protein VLC46_09605 [Thermoanaerobaculia bacterium]|jgi:hypothetical protein|nr:hypothetical protein [Thermoanaerobaculia bacterium]